jgi:DNA-binding CsgD family transcriptional regulator
MNQHRKGQLNRTFSKEEIQIARKHMKKWSPLTIKEMQIKAILRSLLTPVRISINKNTTKKECW